MVKHTKQNKFESLKDLVEWNDLDQRNITGLDDRGEMVSWLKGIFRKGETWKWFCKTLIINRGGKCERCGSEKDLVVHHQDPKNYDDLKEEKFVVLCSSCHLKIESFCGTDESMKRCPNMDKKFLTQYPYKEKEHIVLNKTYNYLKRKWSTSINEKNNPGKWINVSTMSERKEKEVMDACKWLAQNKDKF